MITKIHLPIAPKPKPRGQIGKHGNMTHSIGKYRIWQKEFRRLLKTQSVKPISLPIYAMLIDFGFSRSSRGRKPDLDNTRGAVQDALQKDKNNPIAYIKNDSWINLPHCHDWGHFSDKSSITIYFCQSKAEMMHCLDKYFD